MPGVALLGDLVLAAGVLGCATVALWAPRERRAVGWYVVFGVALALTSVRLGAVWVGVTEAAVGAAATGWLLWRVVRASAPADGAALSADD